MVYLFHEEYFDLPQLPFAEYRNIMTYSIPPNFMVNKILMDLPRHVVEPNYDSRFLSAGNKDQQAYWVLFGLRKKS